jgi:hypothetical protein
VRLYRLLEVTYYSNGSLGIVLSCFRLSVRGTRGVLLILEDVLLDDFIDLIQIASKLKVLEAVALRFRLGSFDDWLRRLSLDYLEKVRTYTLVQVAFLQSSLRRWIGVFCLVKLPNKGALSNTNFKSL